MSLHSFIRKPFHYEFRNCALILIGINFLVFIINRLMPVTVNYLALTPRWLLQYGMFWQVFTYQFVHDQFSLSHIISNMIGLFFFGVSVERRVGSKEFLLLYLLSGTLCGILSLAIYILTGTVDVHLMGASGAIFAILLAYAVLYPDSIIYLWAIIPIPAPILVLGYAAIETFFLVTGTSQGVAHGTHLIWFAVAWAYVVIRFGINPVKVWFRRR